MSGARKTGKEYMEEQGEDPRLGKWMDKETAILHYIQDKEIDEVIERYNSLAKREKLQGHVDTKGKEQVRHKLLYVKGRKKLSLLRVDEMVHSVLKKVKNGSWIY